MPKKKPANRCIESWLKTRYGKASVRVEPTGKVTVLQNDDLSAHCQHNFSITSLGIDEDIPKGAGHHITVDVTVPSSGELEFFCKYHLDERHAGTFLVEG